MPKSIKKEVKAYLKEEAALDDSITKMIFVIGSIAAASGVVYYIWNKLSERTSKASCDNNPSPFCVE